MAMFGKKEKKGKTATPKAAAKPAPAKQAKQPKQPKQPKANVPPDVNTLMLGLSALFLITAMIVLGLNYYWYQTTDPAVLPLSTWAR